VPLVGEESLTHIKCPEQKTVLRYDVADWLSDALTNSEGGRSKIGNQSTTKAVLVVARARHRKETTIENYQRRNG
jgi:hypothetical protein